MSKTKISKSENRRLKAKAAHREAIIAATQVRLAAEGLRRQEELDSWLLQEPDPEKRRRLYEYIVPFIKFANPRFPSIIERPRIIIP